MKTAKEIRVYFDKKKETALKKLQSKCKHVVSDWMDQWWAPGHSSGIQVKVCKICDKTIETRDGFKLQ
jgi:hypothetical protein